MLLRGPSAMPGGTYGFPCGESVCHPIDIPVSGWAQPTMLGLRPMVGRASELLYEVMARRFMNVPRPTRRQLAAHQSMVRGPVLRQGRICIVWGGVLGSFAGDKRSGARVHPEVWCLPPGAEARKPVKYSMTLFCWGGAPRGLLKASYAGGGGGIQLPSPLRIVGGPAA